jgi:uncharacterized protein with GYD domain
MVRAPEPLEALPAGRSSRSRILAAAVLVVAAAGAWFLLGVERSAYLKLDGKSAVAVGELTLMVDGEEVYRRELSAPADRQGFFRKMLEKNVETFETIVKVSPGTHEVVARVTEPDDSTGYRESIVVVLERGETRTVKMSAGRTFGRALSLKTE